MPPQMREHKKPGSLIGRDYRVIDLLVVKTYKLI